jgi:hypothetical protein
MNNDDFMTRLDRRFGELGTVLFVVLCALCAFIAVTTFIYLTATVSSLFLVLPFVALAWIIRAVMK